MPKPSKVLCHVSQSHLARSYGSTCIWISDEILAHTFNSFIRCHKRHGSNVPGPLEAQRRAARRRTTNVAYTSPYNPGYQPFEVFGAKPKDGWWDKQLLQANALTLSSSWLWSFLSPQKLPKTEPPHQDIDVIGITDERFHAKSVEKAEEELLQRLKQIHTYSALMAVLRNMSINLTQHPQLTQIVLEHILQHDWHLDQLEEFLLEPQINPPGSANFFYLLKNLDLYSSVIKELVQRKVFIRAAVLGLVDVEDLKKILMLLPRLNFDSNLSQHTFAWASFSMDLLSALDCSKVIHLSDLGLPFMLEWLKLIKGRQFQPAKAQLLWTVYKFLGHSGRKALRKVVINSIQTIDNTCLNHIPALANFVLSQPHGHLRDILLPVTQDLVSEAVATCDDPRDDREHDEIVAYRKALTSTVLDYQKQIQSIADTAQDDRNLKSETTMPMNHTNEYQIEFDLSDSSYRPSNLEKWYIFLRVLNVPDLTSFYLNSGFFRAYPNDTKFGFGEQQLYVVQLWISMALFDHCRWNLEELTKRKLSSLFSRLFSHYNTGGSEDKLVSFIRTMRSLQLPAKHQLLRYASFVCKDLTHNSQTYSMLVKKVNDLDRGQVLNVSKTRYYISARSSSPALLSEVAESMNEDMHNFETTCRSVIRETEKGPVLVSRLLTHNHELKFALRQAAILSFSSPLRWENEEAAQKTAIGKYSFNQVVKMVNNFAAECVDNYQMSSRNCFRKVFWYYKFLHRCRAPIKPDLLDALWIAGVERYNGSSRIEVLSWLYKISVAYLGEQTARTHLQRAVLRDRNLERIAASIARQESKRQVCESTKPMVRSLELPEDGEEERWSEDAGVSSSMIHSGNAHDAEQTAHSSNPSKTHSRITHSSEEILSESNKTSAVREEEIDNTKRVAPQADPFYQAENSLAKLDKADGMFECSSTSTTTPKERGTAAGLADNRSFESAPVPKSVHATPTSTLSLAVSDPNILEFKSSINLDNTPHADTKTLSQIPQHDHRVSIIPQRGRDELTTNDHEEDQGSDLQEGAAMDGWLNKQYTTLEARMISTRKGKIKKPGRRRSKLLTWM